jgi:putative membrane protein
MVPPGESDPDDEADWIAVKRRTWLAAERTWLAWWRTGVAVAAVAVGVGRLLPEVSKGASWPLRVLGFGYGVLSVVVLAVGAVRQNRVSDALRRDDYAQLSSPLVNWLTAGGILLALGTLAVILGGF